jgi:lipopolysaccharide/colanic/teichoic acid biosynthesis glycosyltransferase
MAVGNAKTVDSPAAPGVIVNAASRRATSAPPQVVSAPRRHTELLEVDSTRPIRRSAGLVDGRRPSDPISPMAAGAKPQTSANARRRMAQSKGGGLAHRVMDVALALAAAVLLAPLMALICAIVKFQGDGPIIFVQQRVGYGGRPFKCFKFRSMVPNAEAKLSEVLGSDPSLREEWARYRKLKRDPRSTRFGEFLRSSSLDELPQIYNILRGEMSVVGPRPVLQSELALYGRWLSCYTSVRPGLTGLWQVSGRNLVPYRRRVAMDRFYANSRSLKLYIAIVIATLPAVILRRGSY